MYKPGPGLDDDVIKDSETYYGDLTKGEELSRCLHGHTQNANETFNAMIWERAPKANYCDVEHSKTLYI